MMTEKYIQKRWLSRTSLRLLLILLVLSLAACYPATYREVPSASQSPTAPMTQVYFYPKEGQTTEQQSRDHYECYNWAMQQTGFDPSQSSIPPERRVKVVPMPPPGHDTAVLAITGAVLGALIAGPRHAGAGEVELLPELHLMRPGSKTLNSWKKLMSIATRRWTPAMRERRATSVVQYQLASKAAATLCNKEY